MGRSTTPTYVVRIIVPGFFYTPSPWRVRSQGQIPGDGQPTDDNLSAYVRGFEASCEPGGANAHLGPQKVTKARIVRQATGETVATYTAPMFGVI
jgi:hypothetical protein